MVFEVSSQKRSEDNSTNNQPLPDAYGKQKNEMEIFCSKIRKQTAFMC